MGLVTRSNTDDQETEMDDQIKMTSAVLAGYLLGRTKQGKRALRLALWLGGGSGGVASSLAQQARTGLEANPALGALLAQVRGPLLAAGRSALTSVVENRANSLADALQSRTASLSLPGGGKVRDIIDADHDDTDDTDDHDDTDDTDKAENTGNAEDTEPDEEEAPRPRRRRPRGESATRDTRQAEAETKRAPRRTAKATAEKAPEKASAKAPEKPSRTRRGTAESATTKREPAKRASSGARTRSSARSGTTRSRGSAR
jgi:hypothetical protein